MRLSEKQKILLSQIQFAGEDGAMIETGRYKNSLQTLRSLVKEGLVKTDKPIGIGESNFLCHYVGPNPVKIIIQKAWELGFQLNESDSHDIWIALKEASLTNSSLY